MVMKASPGSATITPAMTRNLREFNYAMRNSISINRATAGVAENELHNENQPQESSAYRQLELKNGRFISAVLVFVASFALYCFTLAPTVTLVDSGELILAARTFGVAHPPGFPLYLLLAHVASLLPFGNIAVRLHLASALFAALASATMTLLVIEALIAPIQRTKGISQTQLAKRKEQQTPNDSNQSARETKTDSGVISSSIIAPAVIAGLLFAFSKTLWAYATIAEVYTLNTLLIVIISWLMLGWRREAMDVRADQLEASYWKLYIAAFTFGLALGVHHVTVGLMLPALAVLVLSTVGARFFRSKRLLYAALFSFAGLSIYIYLPLAASHSPLMNWGDPRTLERFWWHITGKQYQVYFDFSLLRIAEFLRLASREFGVAWMPLALALAVAGFVSLFRRNAVMLAFLLLIIFFDIAYCLGYEIAEDKDAYYLPAFIALTIAAGFGAQSLITSVQAKIQNPLAPSYAAMLLLMVPLVALFGNFGPNNRSHFLIAHDYVDNILRSLEPHAMLLTTDWQVYAPSLYVREIENKRSDAVVININQLRRSWYYDYLNQSYPELMANARSKVDAFLEDLRAWERYPDAYVRNTALQQRINSRFYEMILALVTRKLEDAPVYVTSEIAFKRGGQDVELTSALIEKYRLAPKGLVFRVSKKADTSDFEEPEILIRGLSSGAFDDDHVVKKKVIPVYVTMAMISGIYFASQGNHEKAIEKFKQALTIDSTSEPAKKALVKSQSALQKRLSWRAGAQSSPGRAGPGK